MVSKPGLHDCYSFVDAAAFFGISRRQALGLFCGNGLLVSPNAVIKGIDGLLRAHEAAEQVPRHARHQAVINDLLKKANRAAVRARRLATAMVSMFV